MGPDSQPSATEGAGPPVAAGAPALVPAPRWMTVLAFAVVVVPFAIAVIRLLAAPGGHLYLPDDLALIDLHTRRAVAWQQQLGVFDHNGWNHPGPAYFYLLSVVYRILGSGAKSLFVGATLINAAAALACVGVVRHRATPARALWAAVWVCVLASLLATVGPGSVTYSEGALGGLVSPWNPMVVIFPLLLFILLCAAAIDRSTVSLVGALLVGSFVVQTNISTMPVVAAVFVVTVAVWLVTVLLDRRRRAAHVGGAERGADGAVAVGVTEAPATRGRVGVWVGGGLVVFVLLWLPPVIQQFTNHPGNFTLIARFFTAAHQGPSLKAALLSVVAVYGVFVVGPSEVMSTFLGGTPHHAALVLLAFAVLVLLAVALTVVGVRQRSRWAGGLGALGLVGLVALVVATTGVVGTVYGYLLVWGIAVPTSTLIGAGMIRFPLRSGNEARTPWTSLSGVRWAACAVAVAVSAVLCVRVVDLPPLRSVSNPEVERLAALTQPVLDRSGRVFVGDAGAGSGITKLLDVEEFIGLVNWLDQAGYHPKVNQLWRAEFGPGYRSNGTEGRQITLTTWTPSSPSLPGYVGRVGDIAVQVTLISGKTAPSVR